MTTPVTKTGDPIISQIGDFRRYQFFFCMLVFLSKFGTGWHTLAHIFLAAPTEYKCVSGNATDGCADECEEAEFDTSVFESTIVTEWNLVCNDFYLASLSQSFVMLGVMLGSMFFGMISDRYTIYRKELMIKCIFHIIILNICP